MKKKIIKDIILEKTLNYFPYSIKKNQDIQKLLLIRSCEFAFVELSKLGKIRGPLHTSVGQEAVAVAVCSSLKMMPCLVITEDTGIILQKMEMLLN